MKRIIKTITALLFAAVMLAGCAAEPPAAPTSTDPLRGIIEGSVYTSDLTELTFTLPEDWVYLPDHKLERYLWSSDMSFDMFAYYKGLSSLWICVAYADLAAAGKTDCSEETYFDLCKERQNTDATDKYEFSDYTDVKVGSNSFKAMSIKKENYDYSHYFYVRRKDDYMIFIFVQIPGKIDIDFIMANFS